MHCPTTQGQVAVSSSSSEGSVPGINNETLFADLCILVVEGRLTTSNGGRANKRGYEEGPHCMVAAGIAPRHQCNVDQNILCARVSQLRRHASLLWQNGIPACIEVLLCPECPCGFARSLSSVPVSSNTAPNNSQGLGNDLLLLEQWRISPIKLKPGEIGAISPLGLVQALRSQLHFSQLSAWYSRSAGTKPCHVHYRITVPEVAHRSCGSQFERSPVEHTFPLAIVAPGQGLQVYVRSLPRAEEIPRVLCPIHQEIQPDATSDVPANVPAASQSPSSLAKRTCVVVASSSANSNNGAKENSRADLGESLLDPPALPRSRSFLRHFHLSPERAIPGTSNSENSAQGGMIRIAKKQALKEPFPDLDIRKQSSKESAIRSKSPPSPPLSALHHRRSKRLARQELMRRRDTTPQTGQTVLDDRMLYPCNRRGKHDCRCALEDEEEEETKDKSGTVARQSNLKKKATTSWQKSIQEHLPKYSEKNNVTKKELIKSMSPSEDLKNSSANDNSTWTKVFNGPSRPNGSSSKDSLTLPSHEFTRVLTVLRDRNSCPAINNGATLKKLPESKNISKCDTNNSLGWPESLWEFNCDKVPSSTLAKTFATFCDLPGAQVDPKTNPPEQVEKNTLTNRAIPTAKDKARFRRRLDSAANMVFHCRTGLPLTSSPAPVRRALGFGQSISRFEYDSSINSVAAIKSALFEPNSKNNGALNGELHRLNFNDLETLSIASSDDSGSPYSPDGSQDGPESPTFKTANRKKHRKPVFPSSHLARLAPGTYTSLLGSFEESVLNGRLEPVSTVQGFTAELGASGSFCPEHIVLPVTVFFYTFGDNDKVSSPYLGHINLGKKGYQVPRCGTVQVTLFNPLGTVIKMFVVQYDLSDMPNNSQTFIRQRTLYLPHDAVDSRDVPPADSQKWLRYLIHLKFSSSKSGRISLHTDIRMLILRKSDHDTATAHDGEYPAWELRSFNHGPTNPKFSRRLER